MSSDTAFVFGLIAVAGALMASNRVRFDVVALGVVLALMLSGVLSVGESLAGFGSSVVIMVAGLLVVGEMLARTGVARAVGDWILQKGGTSELRLLVLIMAGAAVLGSVMSSTAVVAIFIPIVLRIASETRIAASRMLLPMSYAALISGMLTLIATTPNIVVHEELKAAGFEGFGFFGFTVVGLGVLLVAMVYMLTIGRRILPGDDAEAGAAAASRSIQALWEGFRTGEDIQRLLVEAGSPLVGRTLGEANLNDTHGVQVIGLAHGNTARERSVLPRPESSLAAGDELVALGLPEDLERLCAAQRLTALPEDPKERQRWLWELGGATVLVHPESTLVGKSLREAEFRSVHGLLVLGLRHANKPVADFADARLQPADQLLLIGPWSRIRGLMSLTHDFVVLETPKELGEVVPSYRRMPVALAILASMVLLTLFDVVPLVAAVLLAALAGILTRCLSMEDAYRSIPWSGLVLIAGMLPLADALSVTGGTQLIVDVLLSTVGDAGPYVLLSVMFFLTAGLGLVLSNTASAVLVAPIAIYLASAVGLSPYPFAVAVLIAASAAYSTPVSTPVVTLVVEPGRYRFMDFVRNGVPLLLLTWLVTLALAPMIFPFRLG